MHGNSGNTFRDPIGDGILLNTEDLDRDKDVRKYARIMKNIKKMTANNLMQVQLNTLSATTSY